VTIGAHERRWTVQAEARRVRQVGALKKPIAKPEVTEIGLGACRHASLPAAAERAVVLARQIHAAPPFTRRLRRLIGASPNARATLVSPAGSRTPAGPRRRTAREDQGSGRDRARYADLAEEPHTRVMQVGRVELRPADVDHSPRLLARDVAALAEAREPSRAASPRRGRERSALARAPSEPWPGGSVPAPRPQRHDDGGEPGEPNAPRAADRPQSFAIVKTFRRPSTTGAEPGRRPATKDLV